MSVRPDVVEKACILEAGSPTVKYLQ